MEIILVHFRYIPGLLIFFLYFRLTSEDLDGIIEEIDEDGSGTMDFDEFCQMMMT